MIEKGGNVITRLQNKKWASMGSLVICRRFHWWGNAFGYDVKKQNIF